MAFALSTAAGQRLVVDGDRIADPDAGAEYHAAVGSGDLLPGLINAHDHLFLNHYPRLGAPPYPNAYEWGRDLHGRFADVLLRMSTLPREEALLFGALKNLLGGVTTVVHHDPWSDGLSGNDFPVHVARVRVAHSLGFEHNLAGAVAGEESTRHRPVSMHLAEGTDPVAAGEVRAAQRHGLLSRDLVAVHLTGVDAQDIRLLEETNTAVVWCPTSNRFLFGCTVPRGMFDARIDILLGTDALLTADGTMLEELQEAHRLGYLGDARLRDATGAVAARRLNWPEPGLTPGRRADLVLLRRPLFQARPADVGLVIVAGHPRLGDASLAGLFDYCGITSEPLVVGDVPKLVAAPLATVAAKVFQLSPECRRVVDF